MNYAQLVSEIESYTENQFVTNDINTFIQEAERRIYNSVQLPALRKNVIGTTTSGNKYLGIPSDWLSTFSLAVINANNEYLYLLNKDVNFIREAYASGSTQAQPKYYALFDHNTFILGPTPDSAYNVELHYYYYPTSIVTASTTWLGDNYEQALLYACLVQAYTYLKGEPDLLANYEKQYQENMVQLKMLGDGKDRRDAYRSGQVRYEVK